MAKAEFGMVGLGTMGRNFLLNVAEQGFRSVGYDVDPSKRDLLTKEGSEFDLASAVDIEEFVGSLESPRRIMLLVPAGPIVDAVIKDLKPHLNEGDIIIDGGNSHFPDTERRIDDLKSDGIEFVGVGVSGGEEGARHGASIMVGGDPDVYRHLQPILEAASAKVNGEPCAAHVGNGSAGHFVKMVHNGIEYGMMQLIAEAYDLLKRGFKMEAGDIGELFEEWNKGELNSFLIEITAAVLKKTDDETGKPLVDMILDTAGQKGTGKWTSQAALDLGVPVPTIDSAVTMRQLSARKAVRATAAEKLRTTSEPLTIAEEMRADSINFIRDGLYCSFVAAYAQGFAMLRAASEEKGYELDLVEIAKIWRGGCIIRAALLEDIRKIFEKDSALDSLLISDVFAPVIRQKQALLKAFVHFAVSTDIPCMAAAATLNYIKSYASERLPANVIQAQRDYFGAHTYQRTDKDGIFHTEDWDS